MSITDQAIESSIQHFPLIVAFAAGLWWGFPHLFKKTLANGGGELIRKIVQTENAIQSELHRSETQKVVEQAIKQHEQVEAAREVAAHRQLVDDLTDRYDLKPRRNRR
jgi:uncharacterized membrane protein YheB (UPF0754 family)